MRQIGKRGKMNIEALKRNKSNFLSRGITRCERCGSDYGLRFAHRKKRRHYSSVDELSDFNEVLLLCIRCDSVSEYNRDLLESWFRELRN